MQNKTFTSSCFIRKNTSELRAKLVKMGHTICPCCEFDNADWLKVSCNPGLYRSVHGVGYTDETYHQTQKEIFNDFLTTTKFIDCGENEELFLALAALRDDTDKNQYFICTKTYTDGFDITHDKGYFAKCLTDNISSQKYWRKATVEELIEHFKKE